MSGDLRLAADIRNIVANVGNMKSGIFNANGKFRRKHQMKLARSYSGVGVGANRFKIACIGDSQTVGAGAGTGSAGLTGAKAKAYPAILAKLFRNAGFIVSEDSVMGDNRIFDAGTAAVTLYDPKVTFQNSGWSRTTTMALGGYGFSNNSTTDNLIFTPSVAGQNIDVYYTAFGGAGTFTISDAVTPLGAAVNSSVATNFLKASRTRSLSANAINVARTTGGGVGIYTIDQWADDTQISIYNCGSYGSTTTNWSYGVNPFDALRAHSVLAADLIILQLSANDLGQSAPVATMKDNLQTCITAWKANGSDIILVIPFPHGNEGLAVAEQQYIQAFHELAMANSLPLVNLFDRFVDADISAAEYKDDVHLLAEGYTDVAFALWELLRPQ